MFPITSIPLGPLAARRGWDPVVSLPEHMKHSLELVSDQMEPSGTSEQKQLASCWQDLKTKLEFYAY